MSEEMIEPELRHWFFQKLNPEQRMGFLFAAGVAPRTCDLTLGMQHKAIEHIASVLSAYNPNERLREALELILHDATNTKSAPGARLSRIRDYARSALSPLPQGDDT